MENDETLNHPMNALDAAIRAAAHSQPMTQMADGRTFIVTPEGYNFTDITNPDRLRDHIRARVQLDDRASLVTYANRFRDQRSLIIADHDGGTISAHLDWHSSNEHDLSPDHATHTATLKLRDSEEYKRWAATEGKLHAQTDFAYFIEENVADVIDPEPGVLIEICRELEATQGVQFKSGVRLDNGDRSFIYQDETHVKNEMVVPTRIKLSIPLYQGEEPTDITANFRFRVAPDGLMLGFDWHRVEYQRQAKFSELATAAAEETGLPLMYGRVT